MTAPGRPSQDDVIGAIYAQVDAPAWAARNLDALTDVLRDLSRLPEGQVLIRVPRDTGARLLAVLHRAARETVGGPRPVHVAFGDEHTG